MSARESLQELALVFLRLGTIAFGGPAAHIAMMEQEIVQKRRWFTHEQFMDFWAASNLIPGPNSTELAIHIGYSRAGWLGLIVAGVSFILPAMLMVMGVAWAYVHYGELSKVPSILFWLKPVMMAIIIQALWNLSKSVLKHWVYGVFAVVAMMALVLGVNELLVLFMSGVVFWVWHLSKHLKKPPYLLSVSFNLWLLLVSFLKIGSILFGSGYVLLAFLQAEFVHRYGWLTNAQLLDAVAVGQMTPGPVFTTATFIGYILAGPIGAVVATVGIFFPAFVFVALSAPMISTLRQSSLFSSFLDGLNVASFSLMLFVTYTLGQSTWIVTTTIHWLAICLSFVCLVLLMYFRLNSIWLILLGGTIGLLVSNR